MNTWPWQRGTPNVTNATRRDQLQRVLAIADRLRDTFEAHNETNFARAFNDLARGAEALLAAGFDEADLNQLSSTMAGAPSYLDSRSVDYNGPRAPWQEELAPDYWECWHAVLELRVIGER
jgi:hypothetical protein